MIKICLINVVLDGDYQYEQEIPLGMASIGAFLRKKGYQVVFKQCFASRGEDELDSASGVTADIYGFQLNMVNYLQTRNVVTRIKSLRPGAITVFGGPFLISLSETIMRNEPLYDFIILGEGEVTFFELLKAVESQEKDFSSLKGLVWRDRKGMVVVNGYRELVADLDTLPFPARDFLESARRDGKSGGLIESVRMVTSRGCVGNCSFCSVNLYNKVQKGKRWRGRTPKNVVDEIERLSKTYGVRLLNFSDSSFEDPGKLGKCRSRQICEEIIARHIPISIKIYMRCETMNTESDIELLKLYKRAGIDMIIIGAESASEYELEFYEKNATVEDNYRSARILQDLKLFYVFIGFIMFGPNSSVETLRRNIEFLRNFGATDNLMHIANVLILVRDSKLYHVLKQERRVIEPENYWELPRYKFLDHHAGRAAMHWQNVLAEFPYTVEVNKLQVNMENLISRMTNPMNENVLKTLKDEFLEFKIRYAELKARFGRLQYDYFIYLLELLRQDPPQEKLDIIRKEFFESTYKKYLPLYKDLYDGFINKVSGANFGLSGLVFRHFHSTMAINDTKRIEAAR